MPAPNRQIGTKSPRSVDGGSGAGGGGKTGGKGGGGKGRPNATDKSGNGGKKKGGKKKGKGIGYVVDMEPLNPPFDPRMRSIGSPLNQGTGMKRGWFQTEEDNLRVNFLFNPSELAVSTTPMEDYRTSDMVEEDDDAGVSYASIGSSTGITLLYDRTYELTSTKNGLENRFGVYADVAAWYTLMGMLDDMPRNWEDTLMKNPPQPKIGYLFVGPRMVFYGRIAGLSVTYSHWTQKMVPARCAVEMQFDMLPLPSDSDAPLRGKIDRELLPGAHSNGWADDDNHPYIP